MNPLALDCWLDGSDAAALHIEHGGKDRTLSFRELRQAGRERAVAFQRAAMDDPHSTAEPFGHAVLALTSQRPAQLLIDILAGMEAGVPIFPCNQGWWPRERDAALERLRPAWSSGGEDQTTPVLLSYAGRAGRADRVSGDAIPAFPAADQGGSAPRRSSSVSAAETNVALWIASAGANGDPTPYAFHAGQLADRWLVPDPAIAHADVVVVTGELGHAPTLRFVLGALAAGAEVRLTGRAQLSRHLAAGPIHHLCTTPILLRRSLRQLRRLPARQPQVGRGVLHQGAVRPHEAQVWPSLLRGDVLNWISVTEAGGWLATDPGSRSPAAIDVPTEPRFRLGSGTRTATPPGVDSRAGSGTGPGSDLDLDFGIELTLDRDGSVRVDGAACAVASTDTVRPDHGWATGDTALRTPDGALTWRGRHRDRFMVDGLQVDPVEVEAVLAASPLVAEIVLAPRPRPDQDNIAVAVIVPADPEWPPFLDDLAPLMERLPGPARPAALAIVDDVPINAAGAVNRRMVNFDEAGR